MRRVRLSSLLVQSLIWDEVWQKPVTSLSLSLVNTFNQEASRTHDKEADSGDWGIGTKWDPVTPDQTKAHWIPQYSLFIFLSFFVPCPAGRQRWDHHRIVHLSPWLGERGQNFLWIGLKISTTNRCEQEIYIRLGGPTRKFKSIKTILLLLRVFELRLSLQ